MLVKPTIEDLLTKVKSRYTLTILTAKRARQLVNGALPLSPSDTPNFVTTACEEICSEQVVPVKGIVDVYVPLRPEILAERLAQKAALENERLLQAIEDTISRNALSFDADEDDEESDDTPDDLQEQAGRASTDEADANSQDVTDMVEQAASVEDSNAFEELVVISEMTESEEK